jgi:hypothetical protein
LALCYWDDEELDKHFDEAKRMEVIGPVYVEYEAVPQEYPVFVSGETRKDIEHFTDPIKAETSDFYSKAKGWWTFLCILAWRVRYSYCSRSSHRISYEVCLPFLASMFRSYPRMY